MVTTRANPLARVAENVLDRDFESDALNQKWVADVTYIGTASGWLYLQSGTTTSGRIHIECAMEFERATSGGLILQDLSSYSFKGHQKGLSEHRLDALLIAESCDEPGTVQECVARASLVVALPHTHLLAQQEVLSLATLAEESWIQVPRHIHPYLVDKLMDMHRQAGFTPRIVRRVPHIQAILSLVATGIGIALVTTWTAQALQQQGVVYRPLLDVSYQMELHLQWRTDNPSSLLQIFLRIAREVSARQADASKSEIDSSRP